jgi:hypothetical protein
MSAMFGEEYDKQLIDNIRNEKMKRTFKSIEWLKLPDNSNGNYTTGQVHYNTQALAGNKDLLLSEGFVQLPVNAVLETAGANNTLAYPYSVGLKQGGGAGFVDSVQMGLNGKQVTANTRGNDVMSFLRNMLDFTKERVAQYGPSILFAPDSTGSSVCVVNGAAAIVQVVNNKIQQPALAAITTLVSGLPQFNDGLYHRTMWASIANSGTLVANTNVPAFSRIAQQTLARVNTCNTFNGAQGGTQNAQYYQMSITIRLRDLHPVFAALDFPISGSSIDMNLFINSGHVDLTAAAGDLSYCNSSSVRGGNFPLMITDVGETAIGANGGRLTVQIGGTMTAGLHGGSITSNVVSTQLYIPAVTLDEMSQIEILSVGSRVVKYMDFQIQNIPAPVVAGGSIYWNISTGVSNLKRIWILGYNTAANFTGVSPGLVRVNHNPKCSEPYTSSPGFLLDDIVLKLGGSPYYSQSIKYSYEQYLENVNSQYVNGGQIDQNSSGLISFADFQRTPVYVFDVSRNNLLSPDAQLSIELEATNNSAFQMDVWAYIEHEKMFTIRQLGATLQVT